MTKITVSVREFESGVCLECTLKDKSIIITKRIGESD